MTERLNPQENPLEEITLDNEQHVIIEAIQEEEYKGKMVPEYHAKLKNRIVKIPEEIYKASGIKILGNRIKSLIFTTDVALIKNTDAQSVIAVYPFTPQVTIMQSIVNVASMPVFLGVGGGTTTGLRSVQLAFQAEQLGAYGVVVNAPMANDVIQQIREVVDVPVIATLSSQKNDFLGKYKAGADIFNISAGPQTVALTRKVRQALGANVPIIATGGPTNQTILETIEAGANAITYTPPSSAEIFAKIMEEYRQ